MELWHCAARVAIGVDGARRPVRQQRPGALDVARPGVALSGSEPLLVDQIDVEYRQYFTPTGRPTAEWLAATKRLEQTAAEWNRCMAAVAEVDDAVVLHGELAERLARLSLDRSAAVQRLEVAQRAAAAVATLTERVGQECAFADAVAAAHAASVLAVEQRTGLCNEVKVRAAAITEMDASVEHAMAEQTVARTASDAPRRRRVPPPRRSTATPGCRPRVGPSTPLRDA